MNNNKYINITPKGIILEQIQNTASPLNEKWVFYTNQIGNSPKHNKKWLNYYIELLPNGTMVKSWKKIKYFTFPQALLLNLSNEVLQFIQHQFNINWKPILIIVDGADGSGKTTLLNDLIKQWNLRNIKFKMGKCLPSKKDHSDLTHDQFRQLRSSEATKRLFDYDIKQHTYIVIDKSPYCDWYYRKNPDFKEHYQMKWINWHNVEKQMYKGFDIIENAIIIYLDNIDRKTNYFNRGQSGNCDLMKPEVYDHMIDDFEKGIVKKYIEKSKVWKVITENKSRQANWMICDQIITKNKTPWKKWKKDNKSKYPYVSQWINGQWQEKQIY